LYGCAYAPLDHPTAKFSYHLRELDTLVWNKYKPGFPMEIRPIRFRVRHAEDPIIKAIDLSKDFVSVKET